MNVEKLPVNAHVLKWARESLGLSPSDVATKFNKDADDILSWESGDSSPTYVQLEKLAYEIYKRPIAVFFFPAVPSEEPLKTEFRTLPDTITDTLPQEIIKLYRKAKTFQLSLEELHDGLVPDNFDLLRNFSIQKSTDFTLLAESIRVELNVPIEVQLQWRDSEIAFKKWRDALEMKGIFVFKDAFKNDSYSGFCLYDNKYPIIYVNNSMPATRQIFTLFHELGHLLFHSGGIDFRLKNIFNDITPKYSDYEQKCNLFASELLVPKRVLLNFDLEVSEKRFAELAGNFSVSREVILRNYLDLGLVDEPYYRRMADKWINEGKKKDDSGGNYYLTQKAYLGDGFIKLAFGKFYQNKITLENLSEYLNIKAKNVSNFENYIFG